MKSTIFAFIVLFAGFAQAHVEEKTPCQGRAATGMFAQSAASATTVRATTSTNGQR